MAVTPTGISLSDVYFGFFNTPIERLKNQRKPDEKAKKPKPVTDEQLLAIVEELLKEIATVRAELEKAKVSGDADVKMLHGRIDRVGTSVSRTREWVWRNFRTRWSAPDPDPESF